MSIDVYRKAMAMAVATLPGEDRETVEEAALILARLNASKEGSYPTDQAAIKYLFVYGGWVRDIDGEITLINAISMPVATLSHWENEWPEHVKPGKNILDSDVQDALDLLDECGGSMAKENLPSAQSLLDNYLAKDGPLDKFGRKTIWACQRPDVDDPFGNTTSLDFTEEAFAWFKTMPDADTETITEYIEKVREAIWDLNPCQPPKEIDLPLKVSEIEDLLFDCDADMGSGHSGFILMNARTYADVRRCGRDHLDLESRKEVLNAGIHGRLFEAVIVIRREFDYGEVIVCDETLKYTASLHP